MSILRCFTYLSLFATVALARPSSLRHSTSLRAPVRTRIFAKQQLQQLQQPQQQRASSSSSSFSRALVTRPPQNSMTLVRATQEQGQKPEQQDNEEKRLPWWLDPGTKGGALVVPAYTVVFPIGLYYILLNNGVGYERAGPIASFTYCALFVMGWTFTYLFRVANKNMTYVQQLKDYEDAVMVKRLEAMSDQEIIDMLSEAEAAAAKYKDALAQTQQKKTDLPIDQL